MPQLGETVAEGTVTKWLKAVGDHVAKGEPLFEVSTDKVETEIPAPDSGTLSAILVDEGATVDVGTTLAVIGEPGTAAAAPAPPSAPAAAAPPPPGAEADRRLSPVVRRLLAEHSLRADQVTGTGPGGRITRDDVLAAAQPPASGSPVVRRLLESGGVDVRSVRGTGPGGQVTRRDAEAALAASPSAASPGDEVVPFSRIRRATAEHMVRSKATSAHTLMVREADYEAIEAARRAHGASFRAAEGFSLSYLPFCAAAAVEALADFPHLNASVGDDSLVVHGAVNLGIAVDLDADGLVVPVVRDARGRGVRDLAREIHRLADGARHKRLGPDEFAGGTFTITNPGPFGTLMTGAIINQPQVAILSTDAVTRRPVVVEVGGAEAVAIHSVGLLALTFDHRVVDGAYAARYLRRLAELLAGRDWASEL